MNLKNKEQERKLDNTLKLSELKDKTLESFKNDLKKR